MLRHNGYDVAEAASGQAALDALSREVYDPLIVDIAMPGLNGIETVRRASAALPSASALYVTGYAEAGGADPQIDNDPLVKKSLRLGEITNAMPRAIATRPGTKVFRTCSGRAANRDSEEVVRLV